MTGMMLGGRTACYVGLAVLLSAVAAHAEDDPAADVRRHCTAEWPGDYEMQAYCIDRQTEAIRAIVDLREGGSAGAGGAPVEEIVARCWSEWGTAASGTPDYEMIEYCAGRQIEAWQRLNR